MKSEVSRGPILEDARMTDIAVKSRTANNPSRRREESARVGGFGEWQAKKDARRLLVIDWGAGGLGLRGICDGGYALGIGIGMVSLTVRRPAGEFLLQLTVLQLW